MAAENHHLETPRAHVASGCLEKLIYASAACPLNVPCSRVRRDEIGGRFWPRSRDFDAAAAAVCAAPPQSGGKYKTVCSPLLTWYKLIGSHFYYPGVKPGLLW